MINRTEKLLRECLASGDAGAWLERQPEHREQLLPYLELHTSLRRVAPEPPTEAIHRAHQQLMRAVSRQEDASRVGRLGALPAAFMRLGTVAAALVLTLVAVAGASAAFGGGVSVDDVFSTLGFSEHADEGINNASPNAERGRDCASPNAFEGHGNAEDADNADDAHEEDVPRCVPNGDAEGHSPNANASERSDNADDGMNNASDEADKGEHANANADDGSGNADEGSDNANPDAGADPPD